MGEVRSVLDVLKKLNKDKAESDKIGFLRDMPSDFLSKGFISTGSAYLDSKVGGHNRTGMTLLTGWESSGKSSLFLMAVREAQLKYPDKVPVIFDGEGSISDSYLDRMGVDKNNLIIRKEKRLESVLDEAEAFSLADDVSLIGFDSIKSFFSSIDEAKSAEEYSIGGSAKRWNTRVPIISANCFRRGIPLIFVHQWRRDPGKMMGDNRVLSGGEWVKYMPDLHLDLTKKELILDDNKEPIGHVLDVRIKKSKNTAYDGTDTNSLNLYYDGGFNKTDEYVNVLIEKDIVKQGGAWFTFPNENGEEIKQNGKSKVIAYLKENPDTFDFLISKIGAA